VDEGVVERSVNVRNSEDLNSESKADFNEYHFLHIESRMKTIYTDEAIEGIKITCSPSFFLGPRDSTTSSFFSALGGITLQGFIYVRSKYTRYSHLKQSTLNACITFNS
jgi:hypothetical protein